jgi:hypothetical protein
MVEGENKFLDQTRGFKAEGHEGGRQDGVASCQREVGNGKVRSGCEEVGVTVPLTEVNLLGKDDWIVSFYLSGLQNPGCRAHDQSNLRHILAI